MELHKLMSDNTKTLTDFIDFVIKENNKLKFTFTDDYIIFKHNDLTINNCIRQKNIRILYCDIITENAICSSYINLNTCVKFILNILDTQNYNLHQNETINFMIPKNFVTLKDEYEHFFYDKFPKDFKIGKYRHKFIRRNTK